MFLRKSTWAVVTMLLLFIAGDAAAEICLDVNLRFAGRHVSTALIESMQAEVSSIWSPYGVRIQWSAAAGDASCTQALESFDVLVGVKRLRAGAFKPVLGGTWITSSRIDRTPIQIDWNATEQLIRSLTADELYRRLRRSEIDSVDVGRALGRVLAHEIGHVLLGRSHQRRGLMRATFYAGDLVSPQPGTYGLSIEEVERLRALGVHGPNVTSVECRFPSVGSTALRDFRMGSRTLGGGLVQRPEVDPSTAGWLEIEKPHELVDAAEELAHEKLILLRTSFFNARGPHPARARCLRASGASQLRASL